MSKVKLTRREIIMLAMANGGGMGLRSLLTGLPIHFLTTRSIAAVNESYFVYSASGSGDPMNCNVPGTYKSGFDHPPAFANPVNMVLGGKTYQAASVWNNLNNDIKQSANFFHLRTGTNSHNEIDSVMKIFGAVEPISGRGGEMLPSKISYEISKMLARQIQSPLGLGGILTYEGKSQKIYSPRGIKSLFPSGLSSGLIDARKFRDEQLNLIYKDVKSNGTPAQKSFLDEHAISAEKARRLGNSLSEELATVTSDSVEDRMRVTAALLALKVTPAVTLRLGFGGDNHNDTNLVNEAAQHIESINAINFLHDRLKSYGIHDKTTLAILNVFGRTTKVNSRGGRDHWGSQSVMFSFGPKIRAGMIGDTAVDSKGRYQAQGINSVTGTSVNPDIDPNDTLTSAAKSLVAAMGVSETRTNEIITGGKIVKAYLK